MDPASAGIVARPGLSNNANRDSWIVTHNEVASTGRRWKSLTSDTPGPQAENGEGVPPMRAFARVGLDGIGASCRRSRLHNFVTMRYHRLESPTQTSAHAQAQQRSGEIWGRAPRYGTVPRVKAYSGPLPSGARGVEFETDHPPDPGDPPGKASWGPQNPGVTIDGDVAKLKVRVTKNTQR